VHGKSEVGWVPALLVLATLVACGGGGGAGGDPSAAMPPESRSGAPPAGNLGGNVAGFVYVANSGSNNVSAYSINTSTGTLSEISGSPFAAGVGPTSMAVDPSGKFAYVANGGSANFTDTVSAYVINATSGALTSAGTFSTQRLSPRSIAVDASGRFVYTANGGSRTAGFGVLAYAINTGSGGLSPVAGSPFTAGTNPSAVAVSPSGRFAYVTNQASGDDSAFAIELTTGALAAAGRTATESAPLDVSVDPSGRFAYVVNFDGISAYAINSATGGLTSVGPTVAAGSVPVSIAVHPSGNFVYVTNVGSNDVSSYRIDATTGAPTSIGPAMVAGTRPNSVAVASSGNYAFVSNGSSNDISVFAIDLATGALTPVGTPVAAGTGPIAITTTAVK
jgi:6-phosphogluconolactonase